jgi:hypothetical protein
MSESILLYSKEGLEFIKNQNNNYTLVFDMENNNIIMSKIVDLNLIKLIYDLNGDIYEKININIINDEEAILNLLIKNLFEDIGMPQRFSYVHIKKIITENKISFFSESIKNSIPEGMPKESKLLPIKKMLCDCLIITPHKIKFSCNIIYEDYMNISPFAEKMARLILFKIFRRVKQFIENIRI